MNLSLRKNNRTLPSWLKALLTIFVSIVFVGGCVLATIAWRAIEEAEQSLLWPKAPGRIVRSGVDVSIQRDRNRSDGQRRETRSYSAAVEYTFEVDGMAFTGTRIAVVSDQFGSKDWAEATTGRFPAGSSVTVSYNPEKPDQCVLEPGRWGGAVFLLISAGLCLVFPPIVLKAIWSRKPLPSGFHPETKSQRILKGCEFRERVLNWEPGHIVHLQRDAVGLFSVIGGAIIAGLIFGLLIGLVPALVFFSGRGPVFIGQCYLGASLLSALIGGVWLWFDNRSRETRIEWNSQRVHLAAGLSVCDVAFSDVQQLTLNEPKPEKANASDSEHQPRSYPVRLNLVVAGKSWIILESECEAHAIRPVSSQLSSLGGQLARSLKVPFQDREAS